MRSILLRILEMEPARPLIQFFFNVPCPQLKERKRLKAFIPVIFENERRALKTLEYVFTSDEEVLEINRKYLAHDYYTDIISFDLSEKGGIEGTIYISTERVRENAINLDVTFREELHRVIFHGALHLCGYRDKSRNDITKMRQMENQYLSRYFHNIGPRETL